MWHAIVTGLRFALRNSLKAFGSTSLIVLVIAVGIGATTTVYTVIDTVLLRNLPYNEAEKLVFMWGTEARDSTTDRWWHSYPDLQDFEREQKVFSEMSGYRLSNIVMAGDDIQPRRVDAARVDSKFFNLFNVQPEFGRTFTKEEDSFGGEPVLIISRQLWNSLKGDGKDFSDIKLDLDGVIHRVIGVMPAEFNYPQDVLFWMPLVQNVGNPDTNRRGIHNITVLGKLKDGMTLEAAQSQLRRIAADLEETYPDTNINRGVRLELMKHALVGDYQATFLLLLGASLLLLLIICVNVSGVMLARAANRVREVAVRAAIGANRRRLVIEFLIEALFLASLGAILGMLFANAGLQLVLNYAPENIHRLKDIAVDSRILAFSTGLTFAVTLLFGVWPALRVSKVDLVNQLKAGAQSSKFFGRRFGIGNGFVVAEIALAFVLVLLAGLMVRSMQQVLSMPTGFESRNLQVLKIYLPSVNYHPFQNPERINQFYDRLLEDIRAVPGVTSAAVAMAHPLDPNWTTSYWIEGHEPPSSGQFPEANFRPVSTDYFKTAGIRLLQGRSISDSDVQGSPGVVVINKAMADMHFPNENPVGQRLQKNSWWPEYGESGWEIIGVVDNVLFAGLEEPPEPAMYFSGAQWTFEDRFLLMHINAASDAIIPAVREIIWSLDKSVPASEFKAMNFIVSDSLRMRTFNTTLLGVFSLVALLLAGTGVYGLLAYIVSNKTREIGIHLSLGAQRRQVLRRYLLHSGTLVVSGLLIGALLTLLSNRVVEHMLFNVQGLKLGTGVAVGLIFLTVAMLAAALPAARASKVHPMEALRYE
ncbi:MAG: ABC transporter permease [Gammaproteobacteria bacterium]|nr:ABC transporter permease [Gammaproteobacteria bacterium]